MEKNISTILGCDSGYDEAGIAIFGAPFDSTTSFRPGARFGCSAIRNESYGMETYSPYFDEDLSSLNVFDAGDLELPIGDTKSCLSQIKDMAEKIFSDGKSPLMIGGEHLVTLGMALAALDFYPKLCFIHFDAHADLRDDYLGVSLSHACVMRRVWELVGDGRIYSFGIRSGDITEFKWAADGHIYLHKFDFGTLAETVRALGDTPVYFTLDLDVLDPSAFCGTGTPEAGGVTFTELMKAFAAMRHLNIVCADMVELAPMLDASGASTAAACKTLREMLLLMGKGE